MKQHNVLIVEDEENLAKIIQDYLDRDNITSKIISDGNDVVEYVRNNQIDVILLDIMLPNKNGSSICKEIRQFSQVAIIMTTARVDEIDRIIGLEIGADDYVCKPYSPRELVARVKVHLRKKNIASTKHSPYFQLNDDYLTASINDKSIELTYVEYKLLKILHNAKGRIFNRDQLMNAIYTDGRIVSDRTIDSHIKKIRKKLKIINPQTEFVHSIYGCGYKFEFKLP
jgi:two-component system response regulator BaeR